MTEEEKLISDLEQVSADLADNADDDLDWEASDTNYGRVRIDDVEAA